MALPHEERLGMLCGGDKPTDTQMKMAKADADQFVAKISGISPKFAMLPQK